MSTEALFLHDLKNEIFILKLLVKKLNLTGETIDKINNTINKMNDRVIFAFSSKKEEKTKIEVSDMILNMTPDIPNLTYSKDLSETISVMLNRPQFEDVITNIIKNAHEADSTNIKFETKYNSLTIMDNGNCDISIVEKLNSNVKFTSKENGSGLGTQGVREFCKKNSCELVYFLSRYTNSETGKRGLAVRIKFPAAKKWL